MESRGFKLASIDSRSFNLLANSGVGRNELMVNERGAADWQPLWYPRRESNPNRRNRNPIFYPLNYGDGICYAKLGIISDACK